MPVIYVISQQRTPRRYKILYSTPLFFSIAIHHQPERNKFFIIIVILSTLLSTTALYIQYHVHVSCQHRSTYIFQD